MTKIMRQILIWSLICTVITTLIVLVFVEVITVDWIIIKPWKLFVAILLGFTATTFFLYKDSRF